MSTSASNSSTVPESSAIPSSSVGSSSSALSHTANVKSQSADDQDESSSPAGMGRSQQASDSRGTNAEEFFGKDDGEIELVEDGRFSFNGYECPWLREAGLNAAKNSSTTSTRTASGSGPDSAVQSSQVPSNPSLGHPLDQVAEFAIESDSGESRGRRLTRYEDSR